jgi:16S rRNA processing protein RimM
VNNNTDSIKYDINLGRIVGCHGLKGTMKVRTRFNDPDLLLTANKVLIVAKDKDNVVASISDCRLQGDTFFLTVSECSSRTDAEAMVNADVFVSKSELPGLPEDNWWVSDLVGLPVFSTEGAELGTVLAVVGQKSELLEIKRAGQEDKDTVLVPFVRELVPLVDVAGRRIEIKMLPGLFED